MSEAPDVEIVRATLAGDERAAYALDARWRPKVLKFALLRVQDYDAAEDVAQVALAKAFAYLHAYRQDASFKAWLFTIAKNVITDQSRDRFAMRRDATADIAALHDQKGDADRDAIRSETRTRIDAALTKLSPMSRDILVMACEEDRPLKEIAALTGANVNTVKTRIHRARHAFAAHYV